ncbi:MAG TPA: ADP-ribosylglycohydrolase family protein [Bacilli bacterium]
MNQTNRRMEASALGLLIGHQMGQWSERRWWGVAREGRNHQEILAKDLLDSDQLAELLQNPPIITTPGWGPTCYGDLMPYICAIGKEYIKINAPLTPELFRDFLLRERTWIMPQGVGKTCIEVMAEGMNPRIAGLYAPSVLAACGMAWPIAFYHAGYSDIAYEDAVSLSRAQSGGDAVFVTGLIAAMLAEAVKPGSNWADVRAVLISRAGKRNPRLGALILESIDIGNRSADDKEWVESVTHPDYKKNRSAFPVDWMADFYTAVSALEYNDAHSSEGKEFMRILLLGCESRFGSMIAFSIYSALDGGSSIPAIWREMAVGLHTQVLSEWINGSIRMVRRKLEQEADTAKQILKQIKGNVEQSVFYDKVLAAFLAGAIGNVMGSPVEDRDYPWIVEKYGVLDHILDPSRLESEDDSAMAKMWVETYIRCKGRIYTEDLAETFRRKMSRNSFYYDSQHAYDLMMQGMPPHACGHWNVVTGSALMGCFPSGIYHAGAHREAASEVLELAYHYQRGVDVYAAAMLSAAVSEAICEYATVESVLEAAIAAAPAEPLVYFNRLERRDARSYFRKVLAAVEHCSDVLSVRPVLYEHFLEYNGQEPWEVVAFTLAIFKVANGDVKQCMIGGTNIGRDSDTISSQSALISACLHGTSAIPDHLMSLFNDTALAEYKRFSRELVILVKDRCERSLAVADQLV